MTTVVVDKCKVKIDDKGSLWIKAYFNPVKLNGTTYSFLDINEDKVVGVGSEIKFSINRRSQLVIENITKAEHPIDLDICPFCGKRTKELTCLNGYCKGIVKEKLWHLNLH